MSADFSFEVKKVENGYVLKCEYSLGANRCFPTYCCSSFANLETRINEILEKLSEKE